MRGMRLWEIDWAKVVSKNRFRKIGSAEWAEPAKSSSVIVEINHGFCRKYGQTSLTLSKCDKLLAETELFSKKSRTGKISPNFFSWKMVVAKIPLMLGHNWLRDRSSWTDLRPGEVLDLSVRLLERLLRVVLQPLELLLRLLQLDRVALQIFLGNVERVKAV